MNGMTWWALGLGLAVLGGLVAVAMLADRRRFNPTAAPPSRPLRESDKIIARMINAVNHDARSLELGRWFLFHLRRLTAGYRCDPSVPLDFWSIASRMPGANDITKLELQDHMRDLVREACARGGVHKLREFEASALDAHSGVLRGMPGYAERSPIRLP